jgi:hypothetical protein
VIFAAVAIAASAAAGASPSASDELERRLAAARRRAAAAAPGSEASAASSEMGKIGRAYLESGDAGRAREILEEAYALDEENGLVLAELTLAYVRSGEFPFARFYLELAERQAPRAPPEIYAVLGEVYYGLNRLEDAILAWERYRGLGGREPRALERLERARLERSLAARQSTVQTEDFAIFFDASIPKTTVEAAAAHLARAYAAQAAFFGEKLPDRQIVLLYAGRSYFALASAPEWASGVFDGKLRVVVDADGGFTPALAAVLSHELAHALARAASGDRAPAWLHEGLAQWCEDRRVERSEFRALFRGARPAPLPAIDAGLSRRIDRTEARVGYLESLGLIEYLVQARGPGAVACVLSALKEGLSAEDALRRETGLSPAELVSRWKTWAGL